MQANTSSSGSATPPMRGRKPIARASHTSPHTRHSTPLRATQRSPISADICQGLCPGMRFSAPGTQALTQSPQKLHSPRLNSTTGNPPAPGRRMRVGHADRQSPQRVQRCSNDSSAIAQGGRSCGVEGWIRPPKRVRRRVCMSLRAQSPCDLYGFRLDDTLQRGNLDQGQVENCSRSAVLAAVGPTRSSSKRTSSTRTSSCRAP